MQVHRNSKYGEERDNVRLSSGSIGGHSGRVGFKEKGEGL